MKKTWAYGTLAAIALLATTACGYRAATPNKPTTQSLTARDGYYGTTANPGSYSRYGVTSYDGIGTNAYGLNRGDGFFGTTGTGRYTGANPGAYNAFGSTGITGATTYGTGGYGTSGMFGTRGTHGVTGGYGTTGTYGTSGYGTTYGTGLNGTGAYGTGTYGARTYGTTYGTSAYSTSGANAYTSPYAGTNSYTSPYAGNKSIYHETGMRTTQTNMPHTGYAKADATHLRTAANAQNQVYVDRNVLARAVANVTSSVPGVQHSTVLVTDREIFVGLRNTDKDKSAAKEKAKMNAMSISPRYYRVYVSDDPRMADELTRVASRVGNVSAHMPKNDTQINSLVRSFGGTVDGHMGARATTHHTGTGTHTGTR